MRPAWPLLLLPALIGQAAEPARDSATPKSATRRALIICGLPGDDDHRKLYAETVARLHRALTGTYGFPASEVLVRFGNEATRADGPAITSGRGLSNREGIAEDVAEIRRRLGPDDTLWVIVLGHGHYDGRRSHLNIPGPDLEDQAFGKLFNGLKAREQVFFITTSASGFFLKPLAAPGRIVITATEPDLEVNETLFPLALAEVLAEPPEGIDRDKDGSISILELYLAAVANVMQRYVDDENLPSEHAKLDDNGDGHGSELQEMYLPPELGGREVKEPKPSRNQKPAEPKPRPEPKLGPRDDGALSSRTRVTPPSKSAP